MSVTIGKSFITIFFFFFLILNKHFHNLTWTTPSKPPKAFLSESDMMFLVPMSLAFTTTSMVVNMNSIFFTFQSRSFSDLNLVFLNGLIRFWYEHQDMYMTLLDGFTLYLISLMSNPKSNWIWLFKRVEKLLFLFEGLDPDPFNINLEEKKIRINNYTKIQIKESKIQLFVQFVIRLCLYLLLNFKSQDHNYFQD